MIDSSVKFNIEYPEKLSRGTLILKTLFGLIYVWIPHMIILAFYGIAVTVVVFVSWWAILFTGKYPKGLFDFVVKFMRWRLRVEAYWIYLFTDKYPPFNGRE
jgi:Domain of unknown function (DUF4389)